MDVYLLDGTYELFRHFFALPSLVNREGREVAATRGVVSSVIGMLEGGVTHIGMATDHVIESFRNAMWPGYKTSEGMDPRILQQFPLLEDAIAALGVVVWPMVELEADDALGAAAQTSAASPKVGQVLICSPDKDLTQCVRDTRVVVLDRRAGKIVDEAGVIAKFGVRPESIPDYLALVGDSADGFPGLPGWGAKTTAAVLARYVHLEAIPLDTPWNLPVRGPEKLAGVLKDGFALALLFRDIATLRFDAPTLTSPEDLYWAGPTDRFPSICEELEASSFADRVARLIARSSPFAPRG
ncbi:MAG: flap endonuclease [Chloroflexi bacterium]|nr:flap endonuclease [Chloroflexota bacterium]